MACPMLSLVRSDLGRTMRWFGCWCACLAGWFGYACVLRPNLSGGSALLFLAGIRGWRLDGPRLERTFGQAPSYPGEDLLHYELPSLTRRVSRIVLRVPTRRKLLGGRALFEGIPEGTKRQDEGSCRSPPGTSGVLSWLCPNPMYLGTVVYKVTQAPSRGDGRFSPHFPP